MARIAFLLWAYNSLEDDPRKDQFSHLSRVCEGDIIVPGAWRESGHNSGQRVVEGFTYHLSYSYGLPRTVRQLWDFLFLLFKTLQLHYFHKKFDVIITWGTNTPGIAGAIIKLLTGARLIVEIPGTPSAAHLFTQPIRTWSNRLKHALSDCSLNIVLRAADVLRLGNPHQVDGIHAAASVPRAIFHYFVPVSTMVPDDRDENFILFVGHPWYLKGVDILIQAFHKIATRFPMCRLKVVGHCPRREYFERLRGNENRIEFHPGLGRDALLNLFSSCSIFVLPSRTDAAPRVLLEAMAFRKPIIAANVDGIPHYIRDQETGLLFESENVDDLADKLTTLLENPPLACRLATNGHKAVRTLYSEPCFVNAFERMIQSTLKNPNRTLCNRCATTPTSPAAAVPNAGRHDV